MLRCSISNVAPVMPVVGAPTGLVYEKSVIEKAIAESGRCPMTNIPLKREDLIVIKQDQPQLNPPRSLEATSVPSLLVAFQNEWDATVLELFKVRQTLDRTRKELAQALYQHDAACRVIARLSRERDEARNALASVSANGNGAIAVVSSTSSSPQVAVEPFTTEETKALENHLAAYGVARSKRKSMAAPSDKLGWKAHDVIKNLKGAVHIDLDDDSDTAAVGFSDGSVKIYRRSTGKLDREHAFGSAVTKVKVVRNGSKQVLAITDDCKVHFGGGAHGSFQSLTLSSQPLDCCDFANHEYAFVGEASGKWTLFRLSNGIAALTGTSASGTAISSAHTHPDGRFFATGGSSDGDVELWGLEAGRAATLTSGDAKAGAAKFLHFGENGVNLAAGYVSGALKIFDLRKGETAVATFEPPNKSATLCAMSFDPTGQTLMNAFDDGSLFVRNVVKSAAWPVALQVSHAGMLVSASPGNGSCLTLSREGVVTEWR